MSKQLIGIDIGRGFTKAYSEFEKKKRECIFKSVVGAGIELDFDEHEDPIFLSASLVKERFENFFCGILAEKEAYINTRNSLDSKTSDTAKKLLIAVLNKIAVAPTVKIILGVPNKCFTKENLEDIVATYKGKTITIDDKVSGECKKIKIEDISIFRESDAALLYEVTNNKPNNDNDNVMVNIGFRTTELCFYDNKLKYNAKKSKSIETGNKTCLEYVQKLIFNNKGIDRPLEEIDTSKKYNSEKKIGYSVVSESISQEVESFYLNLNEVNLFVCGGTSKNLNLNKRFIKVKSPQMLTAKGLYLIATKKFK